MRKVNWEAMSTIAELVGAAGVVISLLYVATEVRLNTLQVEESNRVQRLEQLDRAFENFSRIRLATIAHPETATIFETGSEDPGLLGAEDRARFEAMLGEFFNASMLLHARVEEGGLYPEVWDNLMFYLDPMLRRPGIAQYWHAVKPGYRTAFVDAVEDWMDRGVP